MQNQFKGFDSRIHVLGFVANKHLHLGLDNLKKMIDLGRPVISKSNQY